LNGNISLSDFAFGFDILVNMSETDLQLLTRYASQRAEDAFTEVVRRHVDLVHSAALRQVRSPELAEEVAQAVFVELARQARHLPPRTVLAAWLYHVTRRRAIDVVRRETGRRLREETAQELQAMNATAEDWTHIEPLLDDAMDALEETDRLAVLLRYFQNKPLREVGQAIGVTDDAAQKRVSRAVERLREFFAKRGVTIGASGLVIVISANAVQTAPVGLALSISTAVAVAGTTVATTTIATATKAIAMTTLQKTLIATALAATLTTGIYEARQNSILRTEVENLQSKQSQLAAQKEQLTRERDNALRQAVASRNPDERLSLEHTELLRLRGEVTRLRMEATKLPKLKADEAAEPVLSEEAAGKKNAELLKSYFELNPGMKIPEAEFVGATQFSEPFHGLAAKLAGFTNTTPQTQEDYRRAAAELRALAEGWFAQNQLAAAARKYQEANGKNSPASVSELQPYFTTVADGPDWKSILERYEVQPSSKFPSMASKLNSEWVITQRSLPDEAFGRRIYIAPGRFMQDVRQPKPRN
jgi:RNA polymerase sigma factor (sigma-70 family)